ncbi:MAG: hypothetical protein J5702_05870 [Bacteroidales bacterium]|nr:hypothetical protein [Bacteroidales bacterium]
MKDKESYETPRAVVLEVKTEGIICASGGGTNPNNPFSGWPEDTWP